MVSVKTELLEENEGILRFRTGIGIPERRVFGWAARPAREYTPVFQLNKDGALSFDNRQAQADICKNWRATRVLAGEMREEALRRVPGALAGRSSRGLFRELLVHYWAYRLKFLLKYAVVTDIGGTDPSAPDYDRNAVWFERPVRSIPDIIRELLRRLRASHSSS